MFFEEIFHFHLCFFETRFFLLFAELSNPLDSECCLIQPADLLFESVVVDLLVLYFIEEFLQELLLVIQAYFDFVVDAVRFLDDQPFQVRDLLHLVPLLVDLADLPHYFFFKIRLSAQVLLGSRQVLVCFFYNQLLELIELPLYLLCVVHIP